jgi:asparagine synthase (glutamine-hydrolysing)
VSGFVGLANAGGAPVDVPLLARLTEAMAYCGPDGRDTWTDGPVGLGHALLSLTPEAGSADAERQPASLDGRTWIAADARIDGRPDLADELRAAGRDVGADTPDAHLVLHAYAAWGERCPEHLIGDFAFALWDGERRELLCARDHFGLVPLYYAEVGKGIAVGNVLPVLLAHPGVSDALNDQAIGDFLAFDWNDDLTTTAFSDVRSLPPAHTLTWRNGQVRMRRYWELDPTPPAAGLEHPLEYVERFTAVLDRAMDDRLRSNRVAAYLSGGMDSGSVVATARDVLRRRVGPTELRAYTIVFGDLMPEEEEGRYARETAARLGVPDEEVLADDVLARPPDGAAGWLFPEPMRIPNRLPDYEVLVRAAGFARPVLTGLGGDPLFAARPPAWTALRAGRLPRMGIRSALRRRRGRDGLELPDWIDGELAKRLDLPGRFHASMEVARQPAGVSAMASPFWVTIFARAHPGALGLPVRLLFPFFDLRLVRCVAETPVVPWHPGKRLLREAMRGRLPDSVVERPKTPLSTGGPDAPDPWLRLAQRPEDMRRRELLLHVPELRHYVDVPKALQMVRAPEGRGMFHFERCLALAHWLGTRRESHAARSR